MKQHFNMQKTRQDHTRRCIEVAQCLLYIESQGQPQMDYRASNKSQNAARCPLTASSTSPHHTHYLLWQPPAPEKKNNLFFQISF